MRTFPFVKSGNGRSNTVKVELQRRGYDPNSIRSLVQIHSLMDVDSDLRSAIQEHVQDY